MTKFKRVLSSDDITNIVFPCDWTENKDQQAACIIAREIEQATIAALKERQEEQKPVAWHTEDHLYDRSATTYDPEVVARWEYKGWPITPLYAHPPMLTDHIPDTSKKTLPEGYALVPIEPTDEMIGKIAVTDNYIKEAFRSFYKSMITAAPKYTGE